MTEPRPHEHDLYTLPQAAAHFRGVTVEDLRELIVEGKLPVVQFKRRKRPKVFLWDVENALKAGRKTWGGAGKTSSKRSKARRTGITPGPSNVLEFAEAVKQETTT